MQSYSYDNEDDGYEIFAAISHEMSSEDYDLLPQAKCGPPTAEEMMDNYRLYYSNY
jgi:hypothetical protein